MGVITGRSLKMDVPLLSWILMGLSFIGICQGLIKNVKRDVFVTCDSAPTKCTYKLSIGSKQTANIKKSKIYCDVGGSTTVAVLIEVGKYTFLIRHTMGGRIRSIKSYKTAKAKDLKEEPDCSDITTTTVATNETTVEPWETIYCISEGGGPCILPYTDSAGKNWTVCEPNGYYYKCATKVDENGVAMAFHNCPVDGSCPLDGYSTTTSGTIKGCLTVNSEHCVFPFKSGCITTKGDKCVFPFKWKDVEYNECTTVSANKPWCATETKDGGELASNSAWGNCQMSGCTPPIPAEKEHTGCAESTANGTEGMGWCATSVGDDNFFANWDYCMIPDCTEEGVTGFTTGTPKSLDGDCGCDIPSSCISGLFGALMGPLEKLGEMFGKVFEMFGGLFGRKLNMKNRLIGNEWEVWTEALIMGKNKTDCDILAHAIGEGLLDIAQNVGRRELEIIKRDVKEARERGMLGGMMDILVAMGIEIPEECKCTCGCQAYPDDGGGMMGAIGGMLGKK